MRSVSRLYNPSYKYNSFSINVTSGGTGVVREHQLQKKSLTPPFYQRRNNERRKKNKSLDTEQIYGYGSQRGSMPRVTVLAGCQQ
jgi:hypothetical protein